MRSVRRIEEGYRHSVGLAIGRGATHVSPVRRAAGKVMRRGSGGEEKKQQTPVLMMAIELPRNL
jgi:hypothetical protein